MSPFGALQVSVTCASGMILGTRVLSLVVIWTSWTWTCFAF